MNAASDKRIAAIRAKARDERALLAALSKQVGTDLKKLMKPASEFLDEVEGYFLAPSVLRHPERSEREWSYWLGNAEIVLRRAVAHRKLIEGYVKKFGPDARVVGGR
jgi:hypothetical protein